MNEGVVADSACLIGFERIQRLDVLEKHFGKLYVPPLVAYEFGITAPWLEIWSPSDQGLVKALGLMVDDGEAEAIALAYERGSHIILDDRKARAVARQMNVPVLGSVGILIEAKRSGVISEVKPLLEALHLNGFRISPTLQSEALRIAGE